MRNIVLRTQNIVNNNKYNINRQILLQYYNIQCSKGVYLKSMTFCQFTPSFSDVHVVFDMCCLLTCGTGYIHIPVHPPTPHICCVSEFVHTAVYVNMLLFTLTWCCLHLHGVVYTYMVLFTFTWCCLHLHVVVYPYMILFTLTWCCLHLHGAVYTYTYTNEHNLTRTWCCLCACGALYHCH